MLKGTCELESVLDFSLDSLNACLACENQWAQMSSISTLQEQGHVNTTLGSGKIGPAQRLVQANPPINYLAVKTNDIRFLYSNFTLLGIDSTIRLST